MTPTTTRATALATVITAAAVVAPAAAPAKLLAPPGPWPAPIVGGENPLLGTPYVFNGGPATANARLRVYLPYGHGRRMAITRAIGRRAVVRGRLRNRDNGHSISGATVQLAAQDVYSGPWSAVGAGRTNRKGRFRLVLPAGYTRRVAVIYWPAVHSGSPVFSRRLLVRAGARVYLKTKMLKHQRIIYRGKVSGAPIPAGGLLVAAQVQNGRHWATVRLVRTHPSGRFTARYRFKTRQRFRVRALVPSQPAWPLYGGYSFTKRVKARR